MEWTVLGAGIFIAMLGLIIKHFKMYNLIAGYNTMPPEKKKNVDIEGLAGLMKSRFLLVGALCLIFFHADFFFELTLIVYMFLALSIVVITFSLAWSGKKYDHN